MMRIALFASAGLAAIVASSTGLARPWLIWNTTASAPTGLYRLVATPSPSVGDLVAVRPPAGLAAWLDRHGYAPHGVVLIKRVAALPPTVVCRFGWRVSVGGRPAGLALPRGRRGDSLPAWRGCLSLRRDQVFLTNPAPGSLDSRYFGPLARTAVIGRVVPLWTGR